MKIQNINFTSRKVNKSDIADLKSAISKNQVLLVDVDTQNGYLNPNIVRADGTRDGLCLNDSNSVKPNFLKIKNSAQGLLPKLETVDKHYFGDPVMDQFKSIADIYCEKGTWGSEKIPETTFGPPDITIEVEPYKQDVPSVDSIKTVLQKKGIINLEKNDLSPITWGNRFTKKLESNFKGVQFFENLKKAGVEVALVYGVATDYCVMKAVGVLKEFGIQSIVIEDAIKEVSEKSTKIKNHPVFKDVPMITTKKLGKILNELR